MSIKILNNKTEDEMTRNGVAYDIIVENQELLILNEAHIEVLIKGDNKIKFTGNYIYDTRSINFIGRLKYLFHGNVVKLIKNK